MFGGDDVEITPGMQRYIDKNNAYLAERDRYIREVVKKWKFDTIAVHGLYSVQEAIEDYQGAIIEPIFMSASQAYRDSDEMAAALAYLIPTWCYSRIANPSTYYYEWMLAMLEEGSGSVKVKIILEWILGVMNRDRSRLQGFLDEEFASDPTFKDQIIDAAGDASVRIDLVSDLLTVLEGQRALDGASD